jgi:hypothetical protein
MTGCEALGTTGFLLLGVDILISASIDEHISSSVKFRFCSVLLSKHRRFETSDCLISGLVLHMMKIIAFYKKKKKKNNLYTVSFNIYILFNI